MNPLVLSLLCALGALGLIAYSVLGKENVLFPQGQRSEKPLPRPIMPVANDIAAQKLEQQINALETETQKLVFEHRSLQVQLELAKKIETDLKVELDSFKQINADRLKVTQGSGEETQALKEKLISKERELEKELSMSSGLKSQLDEKMNKLAAQEKKTSELTDRISGLEAQVNEYKAALKSQASMLEELKGEKETALKKLSEAPAQPGIPPEDYNRLKEKLEQAEEVLRILHAADK